MIDLWAVWWAVKAYLGWVMDRMGRLVHAAAALQACVVIVVGLTAGPGSMLFPAMAGFLAGLTLASAAVVFGVDAARALARRRGVQR